MTTKNKATEATARLQLEIHDACVDGTQIELHPVGDGFDKRTELRFLEVAE